MNITLSSILALRVKDQRQKMSTCLTLIELFWLNARYREKLHQNLATNFQVIGIFLTEKKNTNHSSESQRSRSNVNTI